ncbi:probable ZPR1-protein binds to translation elongation factor eEF-1 [Sporisorium reilianum f. sp. reilianum]|uniref:Probable ZPR1-protein binds to translation elongation factor eEF-1 n=1 Tax=Sporisorium reilianum f. sp. reilianum TaxID=72559 RepID=A0A2N8UKX9_9BASI|nr:probable ZPR1-protein binds to translation elongation factor eEF-1 [Sporisorium reilianum f. sp. reilianum]
MSSTASHQTAPDSKDFFKPIGEHVADDASADAAAGGAEAGEQKMVEEIDSLCMDCHQQGTTRMLLTYIPYFREVIVVSFSCPHCGNRNSEIQSAGQIQPKGCLYTVHVTNPTDLNRQVVKSEFCTVTIPELQIEIPPKKGQLTTIEGVISDTLRDLELDQPLRKHMQPEAYAKIEDVCDKLRAILGEDKPTEEDDAKEDEQSSSGLRSLGPVGGSSSSMSAEDKANRKVPPFSIRLDDPSGNSFVEFMGDVQGRGMSDAKWSKRDFPRSKEQNELLGLSGPAAAGETQDGDQLHTTGFDKDAGETEFDNEEVYTFAGTCSSCNAPLETRMKKVNIPYFKDILIMSTNCDNCGYKDNEVKSGAAISEQGRKLTLTVEDKEDLSRDVLKSETAGFAIPEIDLHLSPGTLGGRFTTLEGLLQQVFDELSERVLMRGDSSTQAATFEGFLGKLKSVISCELLPYTVILDDPLANSYIQNPYAPDPDEQVVEERYTRSYDQNEDLGLNDINVDNYQQEDAPAPAPAA